MTEVNGHTLDWVPSYDPRSRNYAAVIDARTASTSLPSQRSWVIGNSVLNQDPEGACVGHGVSNVLSAYPNRNYFKRPQALAFGLYHAARYVDQWPGEEDNGTSVLAGMKIATDFGFCNGYRWCFGEDDLRRTILGVGCVALGIGWHDSMFRPDANGLITVTGQPVGGHCVAVSGFMPLVTGGLGYRIRNSWGKDWGVRGEAYITQADMARLLADGGEAAIPVPAITNAAIALE